MAKKQIRIRLYRIQDFDIYCLYYDPDFNLQDAFRKVIKAYAAGEAPPQIDVSKIKPLPHGTPVKIAISFSIDDEREILLLSSASRTWRNANNFCKSLLRRSLVGIDNIYLERYEDEPYFSDPMQTAVIKKENNSEDTDNKKEVATEDKQAADKIEEKSQNKEADNQDKKEIKKEPRSIPKRDKNEIPEINKKNKGIDPFSIVRQMSGEED